LGNYVIDLSILEEAGLFDDILFNDETKNGVSCCCTTSSSGVFDRSTLNYFLSQYTKPIWIQIRNRLIDLFVTNVVTEDDRLRTNGALQKAALIPAHTVTMHVPVDIGDYTDFYASREHATNCGKIFRGGKDDNTALPTNWLHLPIGYHGRSSTVFVSPTQVRRPSGQIQQQTDTTASSTSSSYHGPCQKLDFELEVGAIVGGPANPHGRTLSIPEARQRIFGFVLLNDWSARDIQKWEYVPLGPFTSKNFATTISPWIVMVEALASAPTSTGTMQQDPIPLPYLQDPEYASYDIELTVDLQTSSSSTRICTSNFRNVYWNTVQQLVHHTVTGCIMRPGDLLGSGTISGSQPNSYGSLLELSWNGTKPIALGKVNTTDDDKMKAETRTFLHDGDTVIIKGTSYNPSNNRNERVGFGSCRGTILPAVSETAPLVEAVADPTTTPPVFEAQYQNFILHENESITSCTWRCVRIALTAKQVPYTIISTPLEQNEGLPMPLLECTITSTGKTIQFTQPLAAIQFLDRVIPNAKSLIPRHKVPIDGAVTLEIIQSVSTHHPRFQNNLDQTSNLSIAPMMEACLRAVEKLVQQQQKKYHGPYCLGSFSPTIADIYVVTHVQDARNHPYLPVDSICPTLVTIASLCETHPWFLP
jgi:fumarylacetoacetase